MTAAVEFKNVTKCFAGMSHPALDDVSLAIDEGKPYACSAPRAAARPR